MSSYNHSKYYQSETTLAIYLFGHKFAILSYMKSLDVNKPHLIITVGIPGSGKSFFAEHFADTFKAPIISFDQLRNKLFIAPLFSDEESESINRTMDHMLDQVLKTGRTVVYDGKTGLRANRTRIAKKARDFGYEPLFIWVQTESLTAKKRAVKPVIGKPIIDAKHFDVNLKQFSTPHHAEKAVVISGKHTYASQLKIVLKHLSKSRVPDNDPTIPIRPTVKRSFLIR